MVSAALDISNRIRYYHYISGVLVRQQKDPWCSQCKAFANSICDVKEGMTAFELDRSDDLQHAPAELLNLLNEAGNALAVSTPPVDAKGQKKEGNCKMPEGVCFVKLSKKVIDLI